MPEITESTTSSEPTSEDAPTLDLGPAEGPPPSRQVEQPVGGTSRAPEPETFPAAYVRELRQENARYRTRAQEADALAQRLHGALVASTGRLADPTDLPFDAAHLDDEAALTAAIDELLTRKPHLAARRPVGDIGQGATSGPTTVDLAGLLRSRAS
ncbi:hypothetical protein [Geodermatophilus sp. SYSU D01176]